MTVAVLRKAKKFRLKTKDQADTRRWVNSTQLKQLRLSLGLTQQQLANILRVERVTITRAERRGPSRLLQSLIDHSLARGLLTLPPETPKKKPPKKRR